MTKPFVIVGATGAVGRRLAGHLVVMGHHVTVASRDAKRADALAAQLPGVHAHAIDPRRQDPLGDLAPPGIVVDCTGLESTSVTQRLLHGGWDVIDITADGRHTAALLELDAIDAALLVGVGLMPGLSTLLAVRLHELDPGCAAITLSALVGLGDDYGEASKRWTYGQVGRPLPDRPGTRGFTQSEIVDFPGGFGRRRAWQVDFADGVLVPARLGIPVTTRYCFDSRLAGAALSLAARAPGAPDFLRDHPDLTHPPRHATDWYAFVAQTDTGARLSGLGRSQADSTAAMVALAADRLANSEHAGHLTTPDLLDLDDAIGHPALGLLATEET